MSLYAGEGYTLLRVPTKKGLAISVSYRNEIKAAVQTPHVERTAEALRFARERVLKREPCAEVVAALGVYVLDGRDRMRVKIIDRTKTIAMVEADYLDIVGRLLHADPCAAYNPLRRLQVRAEDVIVRHHKKQQARLDGDNRAAFRALRAYLGDAVAISLLDKEEK